MKKILYAFVLLLSFNVKARELQETANPVESVQSNRITNADVSFQLPKYIFTYTNTRVVVKFNNPNSPKLLNNNYQLDLLVNGTNEKVIFDNNGVGNFYYTFKNDEALQILIDDVNYSVQPPLISVWYIVSPLLLVLLFFGYRIISAKEKNKTPKLTVKRNFEKVETQNEIYEPRLKLVRVKELEREEY
ncbi:MAG TPA: hypothetical protein VKG26_13570 [Bacteroidia bacterium]|nr:hypothetical protein [Bacteroidia bacterium]